MSKSDQPEHFQGKEAIGHVVERQAQGIVDAAESHGTEMPGHIAAGADAAKEMAVALLLLSMLLYHFQNPATPLHLPLTIFGISFSLWKLARASYLGWARLERMHRLVEEEKWEIEHHRAQEREELKELYAAKGFEGKLLDQVVDVLMADGDRLLKVMLEEELGLTLEVQEHPLKQGFGALLGAFGAFAVLMAVHFVFPQYGIPVVSFLILAASGAFAAKFEKNKVIPAIVWNMGIGAIAYGTGVFLLDFILNA